MGIENSINSSDELMAWDIADIVKKAAQYVADATNKGYPVRKVIPLIAQKTASDQQLPFGWNDTNGGNLSKESKDAINELKKEVIKNIESVQDNAVTLHENIVSSAIPHIEKIYGQKKQISGVSAYKIGNNSAKSGLETLVASYSYNRNDFENMFCQFQNGDSAIMVSSDEEDEDEEDEYEALEQSAEDQDTRRFAHTKINLNSVIIYYLRVWVLNRLAEDIGSRKKELNVTDEEADALIMYAARIKEFPRALSGLQGQAIKFRPDVLDILPVIVNFTIDSRIADNSTENIVSSQFIATLKLDMLKSPSAHNNQNRPSVHYLDLMHRLHNAPEQEIGKIKREKLRQGYLLWYYIANGTLPQQCDKLSLETAMSVAPPLLTGKFSPQYLSETLSKEDMQAAGADFRLYQTDPINIEENVDKYSFNWMDFFRMDDRDKVTDMYRAIPVHFTLRKKPCKKECPVFSDGQMEYKTRSATRQRYVSVMLCAPQRLAGKRGFTNQFGGLTNNPIPAIYTIPIKNNGQCLRPVVPVIYDVIHAILTNMYLYCRIMLQQNGDYTDLFLPRISGESADDAQPVETTPGSAAYMSALGKSLEQGLSLQSLMSHTQGYVADGDSKTWNYKLDNAASSILNTISRKITGPIGSGFAESRIAIIYLTKFVCDSKNGADEEYSVLSTESLILFGGENGSQIVFMPRTNDICRDSRNSGDSRSEVYNFGDFAAERHLSSLLQFCSERLHVTKVILMMNAPCKITTAMTEKKILGLNRDTIAKLEDHYPDLTFFPMFISKYQVKDSTGEHLVIRNMYQEYDSMDGMVPLDAFVIGKNGFGRNQSGYYRSGCMYQTIKDYYPGRTGQLIKNYLEQPDGADHISIETALLLLHMISDERARQSDPGEGKTDPFDRLKNEIMPSAKIRYSKGRNSQGVIQINYLGLVTAIADILERKV